MTGQLGPRDPMSRIAQRTKERSCEPSWASIFMPSAWRSWRPIHSRKGSCRKPPRSISAEAFRRTLARLHPRHPTVCIKSHAAGNIRPRVYRDPLSAVYISRDKSSVFVAGPAQAPEGKRKTPCLLACVPFALSRLATTNLGFQTSSPPHQRVVRWLISFNHHWTLLASCHMA